ncbi:Importin-beta protein [Ancylostoma duodenale]|uniref:Importin-beta protein n=1 Tax=Ancylostoma duodenale TaxID=51022 RepID=A0A0C2FZ64_9BILA|nr:Importin-beta protein [Ancylostoma duodenale]
MDSNAQEVTLALQGTLQQDPSIRKQAENRIWEYGKVSGFAPLLLRLACSDETAAEIRMAAAIALKNFIRKNWGEAPEVDLSPEEEEEIRQSVLQGMFLIRGTLQGQLSHAVQLMAKIEGKL